jgi:glycerol-3-phosphate dehydrogenase
MGKIYRNAGNAAEKAFDLIIIGGGIYGVMLSFEASRRGLKSLLLEKEDFGGGTSFNHLRILHGGLRYLQSLDLNRFRESVGERSWFLQTFPDLVDIMPCLMPLYGNGARRPGIFRGALALNDLLSRSRNLGVRADRQLPNGRVVCAKETSELFPGVDMGGLEGGAIWFDACMANSERLFIEILRLSCRLGGLALNYMEAAELLKTSEGIGGVGAVDRESGETFEFRAPIVVNAAGPFCRQVASGFDRDFPALFRSSLAWNVLLKNRALSDCALAVAPKKPKGRTYFLVPWKGMILAGTGHAPWADSSRPPAPTIEQLQEFLDDLNLAIPSLAASQADILQIFPGLLPATDEGNTTLSTQEIVVDHGQVGGPKGLYSVSGVKFTTARLVAEKILGQTFPGMPPAKLSNECASDSLDRQNMRGVFAIEWRPDIQTSEWEHALREIILEESVIHLDDLVFRRTTLWNNLSRTMELSSKLCTLFNWDGSRCNTELHRLEEAVGMRTLGKG